MNTRLELAYCEIGTLLVGYSFSHTKTNLKRINAGFWALFLWLKHFAVQKAAQRIKSWTHRANKLQVAQLAHLQGLDPVFGSRINMFVYEPSGAYCRGAWRQHGVSTLEGHWGRCICVDVLFGVDAWLWTHPHHIMWILERCRPSRSIPPI